jgi:serine/threonine protein kinase
LLVQTPETDARLPRFKIADFGLSVLLADGVELSRPPDPWAHLPPELLQSGFRSPNSRCDLYGLGITLPLELVARQGRED